MDYRELKNRPFQERVRFAWSGIHDTAIHSASFRAQLLMGVSAAAVFALLHASALWWAIFLCTSGAILAAELLNSAIEHLLDALHPELHPLIGRAKNCAAAAVLALSLASLAIFALFLFNAFRG